MKKLNAGQPEPHLVAIRSFTDELEADLAKSTLQAFGIHCLITSDDCGGMRPGMSVVNGIRLVVSSNDVDRAEEVLAGKAPDSKDH